MTNKKLLTRIAALERENLTLRRDNQELLEEREELRLEVRRLSGLVEALTRQLDAALRGLDEAAADRLREAVEAARARPRPAPAPPPPRKEEPKRPPKRDPHGRGALPEGLPRVEERHTVTSCDSCGHSDLRVLDTEITEVYDLVPSRLRVRRVVREACLCARCGRRVTAEGPPMPFPRAMCSPAMLAHVVAAKHSLHLPLERIRKELNRQGARLSDATLSGWMRRAAEALAPLRDALRRALLSQEVLQADGTGLKYLVKGRKGRPAAKGHVVVWCTPDIAVFDFAPTKEAVHAEAFLRDGFDAEGRPQRWRGALVTDAERRYVSLGELEGSSWGACNAHARRKFCDIESAAPRLVGELKRFYAAIYGREGEARAAGLEGEALRAHRQACIRPLYDDLHAWLTAHEPDFDPANAFAKAIRYTLRHWAGLTRWVDDPRLPPDNNLAERLLRALALGRKNWLFAGSEAAAHNSCVLMSLVETAKLHGEDPEAYLTWVFERLDRHPVDGSLPAEALMPWAYTRARTQALAG